MIVLRLILMLLPVYAVLGRFLAAGDAHLTHNSPVVKLPH